jgi:hypothetical protein
MLLAFCYLFYFVAATASPLQRRKLSQATHGSGQVAFAFRVSLVVAVLGLLLPLFSPLEIKGSWLTLSLLTLICSFFGAGAEACNRGGHYPCRQPLHTSRHYLWDDLAARRLEILAGARSHTTYWGNLACCQSTPYWAVSVR